MKHKTGGDPITGLKWTRKTTEKIAEELGKLHIEVSPQHSWQAAEEPGIFLAPEQKEAGVGKQESANSPDPQSTV